MNRVRRTSLALCLLLAALAPSGALAHSASVSYSELEVNGAQVDARFHFSAIDLSTLLKVDTNSQPELDALTPALQRMLLTPIVVTSGGKPCTLEPGKAAPDGPDGALLHATFRCAAAIDELSLGAGFIDLFPPGHTHLAKIIFGPDEIFQRVAQAEEPRFDVERTQRPLARATRFLWLGLQHILLGPDHLAFLLALLLLGGTFPELVKIVTSFTVAHSITLAVSALGFVSAPARVVEPLIALSIVYASVENLWALRRKGRVETALAHRWAVAFVFGLVHGFGFATGLGKLPRSGLANGLVSFNLGVELGQILLVALLLPALAFLRKQPGFQTQGARLASSAVAIVGAIWFVSRVLTAAG